PDPYVSAHAGVEVRVIVMTLHKLTAGDGYLYLVRQVAAADSTERGRSTLTDYYSARGESPGRWMGRGLAALSDTGAREISDEVRQQVWMSELSQSLFVESFGDDLENPTARLEDLASVSSGITKGRKTSDSTRPVPYLAVVNVQAGYLALDPIKEIDATEAEIARYALAAGDLVLTEGGDPDKLGRGTLWRNELPLCLHQNHIFRVRVSLDAKLEPEYLSAFMASRTARSYFLRAAKQTTGIASINMTQLRALPTFVPPIADQQRYLHRVAAATRQKRAFAARSAECETLFTSLQSRAFSGQLCGVEADV
ncbi:MAG: relaxase domain-containing protein, partial [Mycobacterium sp.]